MPPFLVSGTMKNNYIIGRQRTKESSKLFFGRISNVNQGIIEGYIEKDSHIQDRKSLFEIPLKDLILDLGQSPHAGSVYGFDVTNRYQGSILHPYFGRLCFFYKPEKEIKNKIIKAFDKAQSILEKLGFEIPYNGNSTWEINSKETKGKWAGSYRHSPKPEINPHRFSIKPESLPDSEFVYVILHEWAHHIHKTAMTSPKLNAHWIKLFNTSIAAKTIKKEVSQRLLQALIAGEEVPSDFKSGLDEEDTLAFNWILRTIKSDNSVSVRELDILFSADYREDIEALWPQRTLFQRDLKPVVSEYATTSYHELIAESVAFYLTKRKLPQSIEKLTAKSLQLARTNS